MVSTGGEYYLGLDIGSLSTKCVVIDAEREIVQTHVTATGCSPGRTGRAVYDDLLARAGIRDGLRGVVATGYGRVSIDFASKRFTEIACHARGAHHHNSGVRTVVDIGGQDSKVIKLNEGGDVIDFCMNDKCAAGTGKFLEIMAKTLTVDLVELGPVAAASRAPCALSSTCSVFAESEVVSLLAEGASREDILAGVCAGLWPGVWATWRCGWDWMETWCLWEASRKTWVCGGNCRSFSASSSLNYRVTHN